MGVPNRPVLGTPIPPRHPSAIPRTLIPLDTISPWNTHPPGTPIPLEHPSPHGTLVNPLII